MGYIKGDTRNLDNGSYYKYVSIIKLSGPQKMHCAQQGLTAQP